MADRIAKLFLVSGDVNSNKFYFMTETNGTIDIEYGRVDVTKIKISKPSREWEKIYNSKIKKGYVDQTELFVEKKDIVDNTTTIKKKKIFTDFLANRKLNVVNIVKQLQSWATGSIKENYSVESKEVTQKQIDTAQGLIDQLAKYVFSTVDITEFNKILLSYYMTVPRKMKHVKDHLLSGDNISELETNRNELVGKEQDTLDVMAGQVQLDTAKSQLYDDGDTSVEDVMTDIIESSGLTFEHIEDNSIINFIKDKMGPNSSQFVEAFEVRNLSNYQEYTTNFDKSINKNTEILWHGSRNENWWSIITNSLKIRPSNVIRTGSMFGSRAIYFASKFQKSFGYTSGRNSYYARGNSNVAVLGLYEVHLGNQKHIYKHDSSCYNLDQSIMDKEGFNSVFAHGGADLRNDEFIIYAEDQCTLKYLVIVKS